MKKESIRPFVWGLVLGAGALAAVEFSAGWVVTTGQMQNEVSTAKVQQLALICADRVIASRAGVENPTDISGWAGRDARRELAVQFAIIMPGQTEADRKVIEACAAKLDV